jgi:hypothetical protein
MSKSNRRIARAILILALLAPTHALTQEDKKTDEDKPADPDTGESTVEEKTLGLLPNPLQKYGVKFAATYIGEAIGNPSGGLKQGAIYEGRLNLAVDLDLEKLVGLDKLIFHANMFQIHGDGLSRSNLQNFFVVSGIEALPSTRLYEAYFEKQWDEKKVSLKFGQLAADSEFFNTKYTDVFTNASMGWPAITSLDLPSGGPSPPLAAMGARLLVNVTDQLSVLGAVFDGDQAGPGLGDPQDRDRYGVNFRINDPPTLGTTRRAIPALRAKSSSAAGGTSAHSPTSVSRPTAFRWRRLPAAASHCCWRVTSEAGWSSSSRSIGCLIATTAVSAFSRGSPGRRPSATSLISMRTEASSSSGSATPVRTTSSGLQRVTPTCRSVHRLWMRIIVLRSIRTGRYAASRAC